MLDLFESGGIRVSMPPFVRVEYEVDPLGWERTGARIITPRDGRPQFILFYTPEQTRQYEEALKQLAALAMRRKQIVDGPCAIRITATMRVPKSWTVKERDAALTGVMMPITRPDFDNIAKMVDAFKGVIWTDDTRVVRALIIKQYGERPSLLVEVYLL